MSSGEWKKGIYTAIIFGMVTTGCTPQSNGVESADNFPLRVRFSQHRWECDTLYQAVDGSSQVVTTFGNEEPIICSNPDQPHIGATDFRYRFFATYTIDDTDETGSQPLANVELYRQATPSEDYRCRKTDPSESFNFGDGLVCIRVDQQAK